MNVLECACFDKAVYCDFSLSSRGAETRCLMTARCFTIRVRTLKGRR